MTERAYETELEIETIETHTAGEPTRIVVDGLDEYVPDEGSVREKMQGFAEDHDWLRELLMQEPRGHADMFGAVLVEPQADEADLGFFFTDVSRYSEMCGHATIGVVTALIETGRLEPAEEITIESPSGLVRAYPTVEDGTVTEVAMRNVEAFVYDSVTVGLDSVGQVDVDLVDSGGYFMLVDADQVGLDIDTDNVEAFRRLTDELAAIVNEHVEFDNPFREAREHVDTAEFYQHDDVQRNVVILGEKRQVDRSPCGTGTCAKATLLYTNGECELGEEFVHESVIGTRFRGKAVAAEEREGYTVVTPEVTGSAHIIGEHTFVKRPDDPVTGFTV